MSYRIRLYQASLWSVILIVAPQRVAAQQAATWNPSSCSKGETERRFDLDKAADRKSFLKARSDCMSRWNRRIPASLLDKDESTIDRSYGQVRQFYVENNYSKEDVANVVTLAWTRFRWESPSQALTEKDFIRLSTSYGQLTINSDPVGATITVDTERWDASTDSTNWTTAGEHVVRLVKKGCRDEEGNASVVAGRDTTFERKLKCP